MANNLNKGVVGETLKLQAVENFFSHDINPGLIDAKIEKRTAAMIRERGGINTQMLIVVGLIIAALCIAGPMGYTMLKQHDQSKELAECEIKLSQKTQPVVTNPTTQQSSNPAIGIQ